MAEKNVIDMETAPETINYRAARQKEWEGIVAAFLDYYQDATNHGASELQARDAAARYIRGYVRWFVGDALTHAAAVDAADFMVNAPRSWGLTSEVLLYADPGVPELVARTYPFTEWAQKLDTLTRAVASDDETWAEWAGEAAATLGIPQATKAMFGATADIASGLGSAAKGVGEGLGTAAKGVGQGLSGIGEGLGAALRYIPVAVAALAAVGVFAFYKYIVPPSRAPVQARAIEGTKQALGRKRSH